MLFLIVIGGIYPGVFSPTEAAASALSWRLHFALGDGKLGWKNF